MAHALQFDKYGDMKDVLQWREYKKPAIVKDTDALVRMVAVPVNPSDTRFIGGTYGKKPESFPAIPGFEGAGVVEEVGKSVKDVKVGQRVHLLSSSNGTWSEYVVVDTSSNVIIPLPDPVSFAEGCQITVNPVTALGMLDELGVKDGSGDFLVQTGAGSAIGRIFVQLGKAKGFKTINIVRRDEQIAELKSIGADYVINSSTTDVTKQIYEITQGQGAKYAVDCIGGIVTAQVIKALGQRGKILLYGRMAEEPLEVDVGLMIFKGLTIRGFWLNRWFQEFSNQIGPTYRTLLTLVATKQLDLASKTFDIKTEFASAAAHSSAPGKNEKTVLLISPQ